jgi:hypothetical protein
VLQKAVDVTMSRFYPPLITLCLGIFICELFKLAAPSYNSDKVAVVCEVLKGFENGLDVLESSSVSVTPLIRFDKMTFSISVNQILI